MPAATSRLTPQSKGTEVSSVPGSRSLPGAPGWLNTTAPGIKMQQIINNTHLLILLLIIIIDCYYSVIINVVQLFAAPNVFHPVLLMILYKHLIQYQLATVKYSLPVCCLYISLSPA